MTYKKILLARVGWMKYYAGSQKGDEKPIGGGKNNEKKIGGEVNNFYNYNNYLFGSFATGSDGVNIKRIDPITNDEELNKVLLIFCARKPIEYGGGQVIVGWYENSTVYKKFRNFKEKNWVFAKAKFSDGCLLPTRFRKCEITGGKNSIGQSNISYLFDSDGKFTKKGWLDKSLTFISEYQGPNLLLDPHEEMDNSEKLELEFETIKSNSQGFNMDPNDKKKVEIFAMEKAIKYFKNKGYLVQDISSSMPCDLKCTKGKEKLYVEVKGSQLNIDKIILTKNEVKFTKDNEKNTCLFLCANINISNNKIDKSKVEIIKPFILKSKNLTPISYFYNI